MQNQTPKLAKKNDGIFTYILLLTVFFSLIELSFFIQLNNAYLSHFNWVTDNMTLPIKKMLPGILLFVFAQIMIHLAYSIFAWAVAALIANLFALSGTKKLIVGIGVWFAGILLVLVANQYYFPNSKFAALSYIALPNPTLTAYVFYLLLSIYSLFLLLAVLEIIKTKAKFFLSGTIVLGVYVGLSQFYSTALPVRSVPSQPNIILIGMDSLRPDYLSYFQGKQSTPFLDAFLKEATVFKEAYTPLARTFPSWSSILSGQYPKTLNIRTNLAPPSHTSFANSLPAILQGAGYHTVFATDENRFSNIDKNFGFDTVITSPIGLNDFLLGTFNDFPLSNFLINTALGEWLFPYSYANRPVYFTYEPDSFLKKIKPALYQERDKPLFLSVHFCLVHYPYLWSSLSGLDTDVEERYARSIERVDQQVKDFYSLLQQANVLQNAIVVILSDHGEALSLPGDRITEAKNYLIKKAPPKFYPPSLEEEAVNEAAGHGGDVLSLSQYRTLLAIKQINNKPSSGRLVREKVSLLDIEPTILDLASMKITKTEGISLKNWVIDQPMKKTLRHIFLESDYSPAAVRTVHPEVAAVVLGGIELFEVNPLTLRLTVKEAMVKKIIDSKQYADIYGDWMLALYPKNETETQPILINLVTGKWTTDLHSEFAKQSPAAVMLKALERFYGKEISKVL